MTALATASKTRRQRMVADAIRQAPVSSQEDLVERLARIGLAVTQATVSRDLNELGAFKVRRGEGIFYALPENAEGPDIKDKRLRRLISDWVESVEAAGNMVVIKTPPGCAHLVGSALDHTSWTEVSGTVAGDDVLLVVVRDGHKAKKVASRIVQMSASADGQKS
jgi:transcriptional regulator of arginine metabolism